MVSSSKKLLICVIHTAKLQLREPTLQATLNNLKKVNSWNVSVEFINSFEPDNIDQAFLKENIKLESPKAGNIYDSLVRSMHVKQVSQVLKHKAALDMFKERTDFHTLLVLEDDVLSSSQIHKELEDALKVFTGDDADVMSLSSPVPKDFKGTVLSLFEHFRFLPTVDAYLVSRKAVEPLVDAYFPVRFQTNVQLSYICQSKSIKLMVYVPNIFVNGSKYGVFLSSLDQNNRLFMNQDYNKLQSVVQKDAFDANDIQEVMEIQSRFTFKEHPDYLYQLALFHMKQKHFEEAKKYFEGAFKVYQENDCVMNSESEFLINYSRIFKYLQNLSTSS